MWCVDFCSTIRPRLVNSSGAAKPWHWMFVCMCLNRMCRMDKAAEDCVQWGNGRYPQLILGLRVPYGPMLNLWQISNNISFPVYNDVYKIMPTGKVTRDIESGSVTERTHVCSSEGARLPRCVDGRWLRKMVVWGPQNKSPNARYWCVRVRVRGSR